MTIKLDNTMNNSLRNSSIEILRLILIFGIILMHCFGEYYSTCQGADLYFGILINSVFNCGVSCFMLISGFYGLKFNLHKFIRIIFLVLFYSYIDFAIKIILSGKFSFASLLKTVFPLLTGKYWYITCYMIIYLLCDYIELFIKNITLIRFKILLIVLILIYYLAPTFLYFQIMNDSGKGIVNMFIVYLTGRFLRQYLDISKFKYSTLFIAFLLNLVFIFTITLCACVILGGVGIRFPIMFRDNSIFIFVNSLIVFLLFIRGEFYSKIINTLSSCILGIYLLESTVRYIIITIPYDELITQSFFGGAIIKTITVSCIVFISSLLIELLRKLCVHILNVDKILDSGVNIIKKTVQNFL